MSATIDNTQYIKDLENFIMEELLPAYIESYSRRGLDANQSYIIKKLLAIMKTKKEVPALLRIKFHSVATKK